MTVCCPSSEPAPGAPPKASFSEHVVSRVADVLGRRRDSRRGFLAGTAVVGSALAVQPSGLHRQARHRLRRRVRRGQHLRRRLDGVLLHGQRRPNSCPPGSFVGGLVEGRQLGVLLRCGPLLHRLQRELPDGAAPATARGATLRRPAHRAATSSATASATRRSPATARSCAASSRARRRGSTTAPARTASATDNRTVTHGAPCLSGNCPSPIAQLYADLGGPGGALGPIVQTERPGPGSSGRYAL